MCATDTDGNGTDTVEVEITLVCDMERLRSRWAPPSDGSFRADVTTVAAFANEPFDPSSPSDGGFSLAEGDRTWISILQTAIRPLGDRDRDGFGDGDEMASGSDPLDPPNSLPVYPYATISEVESDALSLGLPNTEGQ